MRGDWCHEADIEAAIEHAWSRMGGIGSERFAARASNGSLGMRFGD